MSNWLLLYLLLILFMFFFTINCEKNSNTSIINIIEGKSVLLECKENQSSTTKLMKYFWIHNGHHIDHTERIYQKGSNLYINHINKYDNGKFLCIQINENGKGMEIISRHLLHVTWLHSVSVRRLQIQRINTILYCKINGNGLLEIEWLKNDKQLLPNASHILINNKKLIIKKPNENDNGIYKCLVKINKFPNYGKTLASQNDYVLEFGKHHKNRKIMLKNNNFSKLLNNSKCSYNNRNKIDGKNNNNEIYLCRNKRGDRKQEYANELMGTSKFLSKISVKEYEPISLDCDIKLNMKKNNIIVKWRKDGNVIKQIDKNSTMAMSSSSSSSWSPSSSSSSSSFSTSSSSYPTEVNMNATIVREESRISANHKNHSLIISSVISSDHGIYECEIFHENGDVTSGKKMELKIIEQLKFVPQPTSKHLELGQIGKVHCKVQGTPTPQVKWIKESFNELLPPTADDINGTLTFKNVTSDDKGNYTCIAINAQGQINVTITINPVVAPKFLLGPKGPIQINEMGTTMIHCQAIGDPKPTVQWDKDLQYLSNNHSNDNRFRILENGTLHIIDVHLEDEGKYGCTIGNSAGLKREEIHLIVKPAEEFITDETSDGIMITRAVLITMSVAFAYIILVIGLTLWCRYKRQARKARIAMLEKEIVENGGDGGGGGDGHHSGDNGNCGGKNGEIEPCLPDKMKSTKKITTNGTNRTVDGAQKSDDTGASITSKISKKSLSHFDSITISRSSLYELVQIGCGDFGDVFIGKIRKQDIKNNDETSSSATATSNIKTKLLNETENCKSKTSLNEISEIKEDNNSESITDDTEYKQVLVKALNKIKDENICIEFRRQIEMFRAIRHQGVAKLYGLCRDKDPHYLVLEYTDWGDLKQFLLATAKSPSLTSSSSSSLLLLQNTNDKLAENNKIKKTPPPLNMPQFLCIAHQIARGMDAIYKAKFIHKDLATRNCIITSNFITKITYPALTKDKYQCEYYKYKNAWMPLRWLAPECLQEDDYSTKSDVYAFGVFIWELFTCAVKIPFENELTNDEYFIKLQNSNIEWKLPDNIPDELQTIVLSCLNNSPKERPTFSQLCSAFGKCIKNNKTMEIKE